MKQTNRKPQSFKGSDKTGGKRSFKKAPRKEAINGSKESDVKSAYGQAGHNDIAWYAKDSGLIEAAGRLNFNNPLGNKFHRIETEEANIPVEEGAFNNYVPGICALECAPTYGVSDSANSPINIASRRLFTYLRHTLSSNLTGIEAPDLMVYLIACDSIFSFYAWMTRLYGMIGVQSVLNKYVGRDLIYANHVDYQDLLTNLGNFRYYIRLFAAKANRALKLPAGYGVVQRHFWLYSNVFMDQGNDKAQIYMHVPTGFYQWDVGTEVGSDNVGSYAKYMPLFASGEDPLSLERIMEYGNTLLNSVLMDETATNIAGLILRAYGDAGLFTLTEMGDEYVVAPVYQPEILMQIHNTICHGNLDPDYNNTDVRYAQGITPGGSSIIQNWDYVQIVPSNTTLDTYLWCKPKYEMRSVTYDVISSIGSLAVTPIIDMPMSVPSAEDVIIATRNMACFDVEPYTDQPSRLHYITPTEVAMERYVRFVLYYHDDTADYGITSVVVNGTVNQNNLSNMGLVSTFDWFPRLILAWADDDNPMLLIDMWEYDNYTRLDRDTLSKIHEAALIGAFDIPVISSSYSR